MHLRYFIMAAIAGLAIAAPLPGVRKCPTNNEPDPTLDTRTLSGNDPGKCKSS
jgi:hypothetical protein